MYQELAVNPVMAVEANGEKTVSRSRLASCRAISYLASHRESTKLRWFVGGAPLPAVALARCRLIFYGWLN